MVEDEITSEDLAALADLEERALRRAAEGEIEHLDDRAAAATGLRRWR